MLPTDRQIAAFLQRLRAAVAEDRVVIRDYAVEGAASVGWQVEDVLLQLCDLEVGDCHDQVQSTAVEGGLIWVFTPPFWDGGYLWIRLREARNVIVISFHKG